MNSDLLWFLLPATLLGLWLILQEVYDALHDLAWWTLRRLK